MNLTRRQFVQLGGSAGAAVWAASCQTKWNRDLACQLYTVRDLLPDSAEVTLRTLAKIGYREVETSGSDLGRLSPLFEEFSLRPVAGHFSVSVLTGEGNAEEEIGRAKEGGIGYFVIPVLPPQMRGGLDVYKSFAAIMNRFGEQCKSAGLMLAYHNHAFEFEPMEGSSPIEVMMDHFEPGLVGLELDVFWSSVAGVDPVEMLNRYPGRIPLIHLKDKAAGTEQTYDGDDVKLDQFKEVGAGVMDIPAILRAAESEGVQHFIVEQDHCPGDPLESLRESFDYLSEVRI
jgi:sugar phosphate isomerase/epimerase